MKNILALLALVVIVFAGTGWYLNWFHITTTPSEGGRRQVTIDINSHKISQDLQKGKERVGKILNSTPDSQQPTGQNNPNQPTQQTQPHRIPFETNEEGFFVVPREFFEPAQPGQPRQQFQPPQYNPNQ